MDSLLTAIDSILAPKATKQEEKQWEAFASKFSTDELAEMQKEWNKQYIDYRNRVLRSLILEV